MSILDRLRGNTTLHALRTGPTLAVPAIASASVEQCARQWSPAAARNQDGSLTVSPTLRLSGTIPRDEKLWQAASMPPGSAAAYVTTTTAGKGKPDLTRYDLTAGLCRRLGGWWRGKAGDPWQQLHASPPDPVVYAAVELPLEEVIRLLTPHLPGLGVKERDELGYQLDSTYGRVEVDFWSLDPYDTCPLVLQQPWYGSIERMAHYSLYVHEDGDHDARLGIDQAAGTVARATEGLLLDQDGFPWPEPH